MSKVTSGTWLVALDALVVDWGVAIDALIETVALVKVFQKLVCEAVRAGKRSGAKFARSVARHAFKGVALVAAFWTHLRMARSPIDPEVWKLWFACNTNVNVSRLVVLCTSKTCISAFLALSRLS